MDGPNHAYWIICNGILLVFSYAVHLPSTLLHPLMCMNKKKKKKKGDTRGSPAQGTAALVLPAVRRRAALC